MRTFHELFYLGQWVRYYDLWFMLKSSNPYQTLPSQTAQQFVQLPYHSLIGKISYKAQLVGIEVILCEESYTSKCSFLDQERIGKQDTYCGKPISRGLFRSKEGKVLNADVNAAYNIIRKALPNAPWVGGIEGVGFHPYSLEICS